MQGLMEDAYRIEDGKGVVYKRGGVFYARVRVGPNKYVTRSLKTGNKTKAIKDGQRLCNKLELQVEHGIPINIKKFSTVLEEYVAYREKQHEQGHTSIFMLRQVRRVSKFWHKYAGNKLITAIDDGMLRSYEPWRKDYYTLIPKSERPRNAKPNPTDKTLQWEVTYAKQVLKWAKQKGYLGKNPTPTYVQSVKKKRIRPAFTRPEYITLYKTIRKWIKECPNDQYLYTRLLLRDYVLTLANSGMRVGELNNLKYSNLVPFIDELGRENYKIMVTGKTGQRSVIPRVRAKTYIDRMIARRGSIKPHDPVFAMKDGSKIITLIDQFDKVLDMAGLKTNAFGEKFSLYSLRHFYAVIGLDKRIPIFDLARNMGTSVTIIQQYYANHSQTSAQATTLGGAFHPTQVKKKGKREGN